MSKNKPRKEMISKERQIEREKARRITPYEKQEEAKRRKEKQKQPRRIKEMQRETGRGKEK